MVLPLLFPAPDSDLIAHEWGTLTSIASPDGRAISWHPLSSSDELPFFVERLSSVSNFKGGLGGTIRMETPVLYFYSPREATVSVQVIFTKGLITEWYPHASVPVLDPHKDISLDRKATEGSITWNHIHVDPAASSDFPAGPTEDRYYAARQTSSAPLMVDTPSGTERERFLFYRGISALSPPLTASLTKQGAILLQSAVPSDNVPLPASSAPWNSNAHKIGLPQEISNLVIFERRGPSLGYRVLGSLTDQTSLAPPTLDGSLEALSSDLEGILISQGLFPDEAHAMLETWKSSWFEEGARVLYIVPRSFVDSVLPLTITPTPAQITRVFVGRIELITPAVQQAVESAFASDDRATLAKYNRFLEPILRTMLQTSTSPAHQRLLASYLNSAYSNDYSRPSN